DDRPRLVGEIDLLADVETDVLTLGAFADDEFAHARVEFAAFDDPELRPQLPAVRANPAHLRGGSGAISLRHHVHDLRQLRRRERAAIAATGDTGQPGDQREL